MVAVFTNARVAVRTACWRSSAARAPTIPRLAFVAAVGRRVGTGTLTSPVVRFSSTSIAVTVGLGRARGSAAVVAIVADALAPVRNGYGPRSN